MPFFDDLFGSGDGSGNTVDSVWGGSQSTATGNICNPLSPNYDPSDPSCYTSPESNDPPIGSVYTDPTTGITSTQPPFNGTISINQGGTQVSGGTLNTILNDVLSGLAILNKAPYVPTTAQPKQTYPAGYPATTINPATGLPYTVSPVSTGSTGANIENFIRNNTGLLLLVGGAFLLMQMKPLSRGR